MAKTKAKKECPFCGGTGAAPAERCTLEPARPGTRWDFRHENGRSWCANCKCDYNTHGSPYCHLDCREPFGPCQKEKGHDGQCIDWNGGVFQGVEYEVNDALLQSLPAYVRKEA